MIWTRGARGKMRIYLQNEAPRLGCGWRVVEVTIGNRRATLRISGTTRTAKIPRAVFNAMMEGNERP